MVRRTDKIRCYTLQFMIKSPFEHNPKAMSTVEPEEKISFDDFHKNIQKQLKQKYDTTRSGNVG